MNKLHIKKFVDTNILIYAYDISAKEKHNISKNIISEIWNLQNGYISIQVLQEFYITTTRKVHIPLSKDESIGIIKELSLWNVYSPNKEDIVVAINLQDKYMISFWDAMILMSAKKCNCSILFTEDLNNNQIYDGVTAINPFLKFSN